MTQFIVSVKRDRKEAAPEDLPAELSKIEGLTVTGSATPTRIHIEASGAAIQETKARFSDICWIEELIIHNQS